MYIAEGTITQQAGSGRRTVITDEVRRIVEEQMRGDDETTASQLHVRLTSLGHTLNVRTILRCRTSLVWVFGGSAYCQLIRDATSQRDWTLLESIEARTSPIAFSPTNTMSNLRRTDGEEGEPPKNKPQ